MCVESDTALSSLSIWPPYYFPAKPPCPLPLHQPSCFLFWDIAFIGGARGVHVWALGRRASMRLREETRPQGSGEGLLRILLLRCMVARTWILAWVHSLYKYVLYALLASLPTLGRASACNLNFWTLMLEASTFWSFSSSFCQLPIVSLNQILPFLEFTFPFLPGLLTLAVIVLEFSSFIETAVNFKVMAAQQTLVL